MVGTNSESDITAEAIKLMSYPDLPADVLYVIFRRISKKWLIEISSICPRLADAINNDERLWKERRIRYLPKRPYTFEELYTGSFPVDEISLKGCQVKSPASSGVIKVQEVDVLDLTDIMIADTKTLQALLTKYQCRTLILERRFLPIINNQRSFTTDMVLPKQTHTERLIVKEKYNRNMPAFPMTCIIDSCANLTSLDLNDSFTAPDNVELIRISHILPESLQVLKIRNAPVSYRFFEKLAMKCPNLRVLEMDSGCLHCPYLTEFKNLAFLYLCSEKFPNNFEVYHKDLVRFPALKMVTFLLNKDQMTNYMLRKNVNDLKCALALRGTNVDISTWESKDILTRFFAILSFLQLLLTYAPQQEQTTY